MRKQRQRLGTVGSADGARDHNRRTSSLPTSGAAERPLTREEAGRIAWKLYATEAPAVVELLLLAHNTEVPTLKRYQASMALEWFDPSVDLPSPAVEEEPPALRAIRWCIYAYDPEARKQAAAAASFHLERWR